MYDTVIAELGRALSAMCPLGIREMGKGLWYEAQYQKGYHDWSRALFGRSAPIALMWHKHCGKSSDVPRPSQDLIAQVAKLHGVSVQDIIGPCRQERYVLPRCEAMRVVRAARPHTSYPQIGRMFGNRDHTTCLHHIKGRCACDRKRAKMAPQSAGVAAE